MVRFLPVLAASTIGVLTAVGGYTFIYARRYSYLTDDPAACANCHVMENHLRAWRTSSHRAVAVCTDCHTPPGVVTKYASKSLNGFNHSLVFTTERFPEPIRITPRNAAVTDLRTVDQVRTRYGGSEAVPRTPTQADHARSWLSRGSRRTRA